MSVLVETQGANMSDITELDNPTSRDSANNTETSNLQRQAKDVQKLVQSIIDAPDINMDKIEEIQKLIAEGSYKINAKAIADEIIALKKDKQTK